MIPNEIILLSIVIGGILLTACASLLPLRYQGRVFKGTVVYLGLGFIGYFYSTIVASKVLIQ
jgi:hypothetical protein